MMIEPRRDESSSFTSYINIIDQENNYNNNNNNNNNQKMRIDNQSINRDYSNGIDLDLKK